MWLKGGALVHDFEVIFLDYRICENFLGDTLQLFLSFLVVPAIEIENEELSLADLSNG